MPRTQVPREVSAADFLGKLSVDERALCVRLIRILRDRCYWLGPFLEYLLSADAKLETTKMLAIEDVFEEFKQLKNMCSWEVTIDRWRKNAPALLEVHGRRYWPQHADKASEREVDAMVEGDFADLVKLWRLEHPEPVPSPRERAVERMKKALKRSERENRRIERD